MIQRAFFILILVDWLHNVGFYSDLTWVENIPRTDMVINKSGWNYLGDSWSYTTSDISRKQTTASNNNRKAKNNFARMCEKSDGHAWLWNSWTLPHERTSLLAQSCHASHQRSAMTWRRQVTWYSEILRHIKLYFFTKCKLFPFIRTVMVLHARL